MKEVHRYYTSRAQGNNKTEAPPILVEIGLMERFNWTPNQIDDIPLGRLQRIFVAMEQRDHSKIAASEIEQQRMSKKQKQRSIKR